MDRFLKIVYKTLAVFFTVSLFLIFGFISIIVPASSKGFYERQFVKISSFGFSPIDAVRDEASNMTTQKAREYLEDITVDEMVDLMMHTIRYCLYLEDDLNPTVDGEYLELYRADEKSHMRDVKRVFGSGMIIVGVALAVFIAVLILGLKNKREYYLTCRKIPYYTLIGIFAFIGLIGIFALIDFDLAFEMFHQIFFGENYAFSSGVMIWTIGFIFTDLVPIIFVIWIALLVAFVFGIIGYNKYLRKKLTDEN